MENVRKFQIYVTELKNAITKWKKSQMDQQLLEEAVRTSELREQARALFTQSGKEDRMGKTVKTTSSDGRLLHRETRVRRGRNEQENFFKEITAENFPNLSKKQKSRPSSPEIFKKIYLRDPRYRHILTGTALRTKAQGSEEAPVSKAEAVSWPHSQSQRLSLLISSPKGNTHLHPLLDASQSRDTAALPGNAPSLHRLGARGSWLSTAAQERKRSDSGASPSSR